jgi:outer membrane protein
VLGAWTRWLALAGAALLAPSFTSVAQAESLAEALAEAYERNPELAAQRAQLRVIDEQVPAALAGGRPAFGMRLNFDQAGLGAFNDNGRTYTAGGSVTWTVYQAGRVRTATTAAENRILAARARLRATENQIVVAVVTAYADVLRFGELVALNENQVKVLERELQANMDRFDVGDLTLTDVAQSRARLANAQAGLVTAENQLAAARQAYFRAVGHAPNDLEPLPPLPPMPGSQGQAADFAEANNPNILAARFEEAAARYDVKTVEKQRLPTVTSEFRASYLMFEGGGGGANFVRQGQFVAQDAIVTATVPIWQGGRFGTQIREAQARRSQLMEQISVVSRQTKEQVINSYNQLRAARAIIKASQAAVEANELAAEGVKEENQVGARTIIEVLNAEQELLNTRVNLATALRDEQVAAYSLLAAAGGAEVLALGVDSVFYDPETNARRVRHKIGDDGDESPEALPAPPRSSAIRTMAIGPEIP